MKLISLSDIQHAKENISDRLKPTPILYSASLSEKHNKNIYLKLENLNITGAFKIRGAYHVIKSNKHKFTKGVITASAGNHAQALALACKWNDVRCQVFMPKYTPKTKIKRTRAFGAEIKLKGENFDAASNIAREYSEKEGIPFISPFANPFVIAGQGTIGLELADQIPNLDCVLVPVGGGGMISGIACALKSTNPDIKVIGVQTSYYPTISNKFSGKHEVKENKSISIADGIAVKSPGDINIAMIEKYVDNVIAVEESKISSSVLYLLESEKISAEGAGAAAIAPFLEVELNLDKAPDAKNICVIISGGNIDVNLINRILTRGLVDSGRLCRLIVTLQDTPGELSKFIGLLSEMGVNIVDIQHNRIFTGLEAYRVECSFDLETMDFDQQQSMSDELIKLGYSIHFDRD